MSVQMAGNPNPQIPTCGSGATSEKRLGEFRTIAPPGRTSLGYWGSMHPIEFTAAVDSWADPVRIWLAQPWTA